MSTRTLKVGIYFLTEWGRCKLRQIHLLQISTPNHFSVPRFHTADVTFGFQLLLICCKLLIKISSPIANCILLQARFLENNSQILRRKWKTRPFWVTLEGWSRWLRYHSSILRTFWQRAQPKKQSTSPSSSSLARQKVATRKFMAYITSIIVSIKWSRVLRVWSA